MEETSQYRYHSARKTLTLSRIDHSQVKSNTGFRRIPSWISQTRNTPSASSTPVYSQFTAPRGGNCGTSLPCNFRSFSPPSSHHPPLPPSFAHLPSSQQPAATLPSVTLHYLPLRNVEDASFHSSARKISSAVSLVLAQAPGSWNSATILNCYNAFENSASVLQMIRNSRCKSNCKYRNAIDIIHCKTGQIKVLLR